MATDTKERTVISSGERLEEVFSVFNDFTNQDFRQKVCELVIRRGGHVETAPVHHVLSKKLWNGSLELHFADCPTAQEVVCIAKAAHADDFGMSDDKTLWFWWD